MRNLMKRIVMVSIVLMLAITQSAGAITTLKAQESEGALQVKIEEKDKLSVDAKVSINDISIEEVEIFLEGNSVDKKGVQGDTILFSLYSNGEYLIKGYDKNKNIIREKTANVTTLEDFFVQESTSNNTVIVGSRLKETEKIIVDEEIEIIISDSVFGKKGEFIVEPNKNYTFKAIDEEGKVLATTTYQKEGSKNTDEIKDVGSSKAILGSSSVLGVDTFAASPRASTNWASASYGAKVLTDHSYGFNDPENLIIPGATFSAKDNNFTESNPYYITIDLGEVRPVRGWDLYNGSWPNFASRFYIEVSNESPKGAFTRVYTSTGTGSNEAYNNSSGYKSACAFNGRYWRVVLTKAGYYTPQMDYLKLIDSPSSDNYLNGITFGPDISMSGNFSRTSYTYNIQIPANTIYVPIKVDKSDENAIAYSINDVFNRNTFVNISVWTRNSADQIMPTPSGQIDITVVSETGSKRTYTFNYTRKAASSDNYLTNIEFNQTVKMSPVFSKATQEYTVIAPATTTSIGIKATPSYTGTRIYVNGVQTFEGYVTINNLTSSLQSIPIRVISDTGYSRTYTLKIRRASSVSTLSNLSLNNGGVSYSFSSTTTNYTVPIANTLNSVTMKPTLSDSNASIKINGTTVSNNGTYTLSLPDTASTSVNVVVTAEDTRSSKTYKYTFTKTFSKVTYNSNGGSGSIPTDTTAYKDGQTVNVNFTTVPTRVNYTFLGWSTNFLAPTPMYASNATKTFTINNNVTLYAVWKEKTTVQIAEQAQTYIYDGSTKAFNVQGTPPTGYDVIYKQNGVVVTNPTKAGNYDVIVTRNEDSNYASYSKAIMSGLVIKLPNLTGTPTFIDGHQTPTYGVEITVGPADLNVTSNLHYKWYRSANKEYDPVDDSYLKEGIAHTPTKEDIGKFLIVIVSSDDAEGQKIIVLEKVISKEKVSAPTGIDFSFDGTDGGSITGTTINMEFSINGGTNYYPCSDLNSALSALQISSITEDKDILVRYKASETAFASPTTVIDIKEFLPIVVPTGITTHPATDIHTADGKIHIPDGLSNSVLEYQKAGDSSWNTISTKEITGLMASTYFVRFKATEKTLPSQHAAVLVEPCLKGDLLFLNASSYRYGQELQIDGSELKPSTNITYNWYRSEDKVTKGEMLYSGEKYTPVKEDIGKYILVEASSTDAAGVQIVASGEIEKEEQQAPDGIDFSFDGLIDGTITGTTVKMEYSLDGGNSYQGCSANSTKIVNAINGISSDKGIQIRYKENDTQKASDSTNLTILENTNTVSGVTGVDCTTASNNNGKLKNVSDNMEYKKSDASTYKSVDAQKTEVGNLEPGEYFVRFKASANSLPSRYTKVIIRECLSDAKILASNGYMYGNEVEAYVEGENDTMSYTWYRSDKKELDASATNLKNNKNTYTIVSDDIDKYLIVVITTDSKTRITASDKITKREVVAVINSVENKTYDGNTKINGTLSLENVLINDSSNVKANGTFTFDTKEAEQNKKVSVDNIQISGTKAAYYTLKEMNIISKDTNGYIEAKEVALEWQNYTGLIYDKTEKNIQAKVKDGDLIGSEICQVIIENGNGVDVGDYIAKAILKNANYKINNRDETFTYSIAKKVIQAKYQEEVIHFKETPNKIIEYIGFVGEENEGNASDFVEPTIKEDLPVNTGIYNIELEGGSAKNYRIDLSQQGTLTILNASLENEVIVKNYEGTYDGKNHGIEMEAPTGASIKYFSDSQRTKELAAGEEKSMHVGETPRTIYYKVSLENYDDLKGNASITILPKEVKVTWGVENYVYDEQQHIPSVAVEKDIDGKEIESKVTLVRGDGVQAGDHTAKVVLEDSDYIVGKDSVTKTYSIEKAKAKTLSLFGYKKEYILGQKVFYVVLGKEQGSKYVYESTDPTIAQIDKTTGMVTLRKEGYFKIRVLAVDNSNYKDSEVISETIHVKNLESNSGNIPNKDEIENVITKTPDTDVDTKDINGEIVDGKINLLSKVEEKAGKLIIRTKTGEIAITKSEGLEITNLEGLINSVLTKGQIKEVEAGKALTIEVVKEESKVTDKTEQRIKEKAKEQEIEIGKYYEIYIKVEGKVVKSIGQDILLTIDIPKELQKDNREYYMLHERNESVEVLNDEDQEAKTITIKTKSFSPYVLGYKETKQSVEVKKTDNTLRYVGILGALVAIGGIVLMLAKRKKKS